MVRSCQALGGAPAHPPPPSSHPERSCTRTMRSGRGHCTSVVAHSCMREHHTIHADPRLEWRSLQAGFVHQDTSGAPLPPPSQQNTRTRPLVSRVQAAHFARRGTDACVSNAMEINWHRTVRTWHCQLTMLVIREIVSKLSFTQSSASIAASFIFSGVSSSSSTT